MITAKEARAKVLIQSSLNDHMDCIEKCINAAVREGRMHTEICMNFSNDDPGTLEDLKTAIRIELERFGYRATFGFFNNLTIDWRCPIK